MVVLCESHLAATYFVAVEHPFLPLQDHWQAVCGNVTDRPTAPDVAFRLGAAPAARGGAVGCFDHKDEQGRPLRSTASTCRPLGPGGIAEVAPRIRAAGIGNQAVGGVRAELLFGTHWGCGQYAGGVGSFTVRAFLRCFWSTTMRNGLDTKSGLEVVPVRPIRM